MQLPSPDMFLINKPKLIPQGAFEAWLWRRWHAGI
jgi:hypothetical protein